MLIRDIIEGKSPHKKGTKKYKKHMAAMHAGESVKEEATAGATSAGNIATVASPPAAYHKPKKKGKYGAPKAPQKKNPDGTAKNALDVSNNIMGGKPIKR